LREEERPVLLPSYRGVDGAAKAASRFNERLQHRLEIEGPLSSVLVYRTGVGLFARSKRRNLAGKFHFELPSLAHLRVRAPRQAHGEHRAFAVLTRHGHIAAHHAREPAAFLTRDTPRQLPISSEMSR